MKEFNVDAFIGLSLDGAHLVAESNGYRIRVMSEDGFANGGTCDVDMFKINVHINNGKITQAHLG